MVRFWHEEAPAKRGRKLHQNENEPTMKKRKEKENTHKTNAIDSNNGFELVHKAVCYGSFDVDSRHTC